MDQCRETEKTSQNRPTTAVEEAVVQRCCWMLEVGVGTGGGIQSIWYERFQSASCQSSSSTPSSCKRKGSCRQSCRRRGSCRQSCRRKGSCRQSCRRKGSCRQSCRPEGPPRSSSWPGTLNLATNAKPNCALQLIQQQCWIWWFISLFG